MKIPCKIFTKVTADVQRGRRYSMIWSPLPSLGPSPTQVMAERPASWKKLSALSQSGDSAVKLERSYHLNDEDETEVEPDNVAKGWGEMCSFSPDGEELPVCP